MPQPWRSFLKQFATEDAPRIITSCSGTGAAEEAVAVIWQGLGSCLAAADDSQVCRNFMQMNAGAAAPIEVFESFKDLLRRPHGLLCDIVVMSTASSFRFGSGDVFQDPRCRPLQQLLRDLEEQASRPRPWVPKALIVENMLGFRECGPHEDKSPLERLIKSLRKRGWIASHRTLCASTFGLPLRCPRIYVVAVPDLDRDHAAAQRLWA